MKRRPAFSATVDGLEAMLRAGRAASVRAELLSMARGSVPRALRARLANLARRAEAPALALRWLRPYVRPSRGAPESATDTEKSEYAASLIRLGAVDEGLTLLESVDVRAAPDALLFRAFGLVARWAYAESVEPLERYLETPGLSPYQALVGRMNLAASLVVERRHRAVDSLLPELLEETARGGHWLLRAKALQLGAQAAVARSRWEEGEGFLREAEVRLEKSGALERLLVRKWQAVLARLREPGDGKAKRLLRNVRAEALGLRHWETVRQCDAYEAVASKGRALALKVCFGTPFEPFRRRFLEDFGSLEVPSHHEWGSGRVFDVGSGRGAKARERLEPGMALHRVLVALTKDFYRPVPLATLFQELYSGQYFDPASSPARVERVVRRFREWARAARVPLRVVHEGTGYRLVPAKVALRVTLVATRPDRNELQWARIVEGCGSEAFSAAEAARVLGASPRTALSLLQAGVMAGRFERLGHARSTRYRGR
jgi:hypothetical protein